MRQRLLARVDTIDQYLDALRLPTGGAVRVSFGLASTATDAERLVAFVQSTYLNRDVGVGSPLPPRLRC